MIDINILLSSELRDAVEANLDRDPVQIALDWRVPHAATVASQVKYLQRAKTKLPAWYSARCVLSSLAFEQSSSEAAAERKKWSGRLCIDLTCGLGVDSWAFSRHFERVIAVERDADLAAIARENFRRLGASNIEVVNASAEDFLEEFAAGKWTSGAEFVADAAAQKNASQPIIDLIYIDPDRRNAAGKKMVRIEDCSPDIAALLPKIRAISSRFVVKLSPLFDVAEVFHVFGPQTRAEVISLAGECKEIIAEVADDIAEPTVRAAIIGGQTTEYQYDSDWAAPVCEFTPELYRWLVVPDVALQKGRLARRYFAERGVYIDSDNGYGFCVSAPGEVMGKTLEINTLEPFNPKALKRRLKSEGIKNIDILHRNFPLSTAEIARQIGVSERGKNGKNDGGGTPKFAFTRAAGRLWQIELK